MTRHWVMIFMLDGATPVGWRRMKTEKSSIDEIFAEVSAVLNEPSYGASIDPQWDTLLIEALGLEKRGPRRS